MSVNEAPRAAAVMVVTQRADEALVRWWLPAVLALAEPGLRGDRRAVLEALQRLRVDLACGRTAFGEAAAHEMAERIGMLVERMRPEVDTEVFGALPRPQRVDVLVAMRNLGSLDDGEFQAGAELRVVAERMNSAAIGVSAIDPSRPAVDGGCLWSDPERFSRVEMTPAILRAREWAAYVGAQQQRIRGRRAGASPVTVVYRVVVDNTPLQDLDRDLGVRKGTCAKVVKAGLALYVAMHRAEITKSA